MFFPNRTARRGMGRPRVAPSPVAVSANPSDMWSFRNQDDSAEDETIRGSFLHRGFAGNGEVDRRGNEAESVRFFM